MESGRDDALMRREAIGVVAGSLVGFSGCLSGASSESGDDGVVLTRLSVQNASTASHVVGVTVLHNGDVVRSDDYDVGPRKEGVLGGEVIPLDHHEPGTVVIRTDMNTQQTEADLTDRYGNACSKAMVRIGSDDHLSILSSNDGTDCLNESPS